MYVLGVHDHGTDRDRLEPVVDRIVDRFSLAGRVGVVRYDATIADGTTTAADGLTVGGDVTYDLGADGDWTATGTGMDVADALDQLTPTCDYAVVVGVPGLRYPSVLVGSPGERDVDADDTDGADTAGERLATVESPADVDADAILESLQATEPHETLESLVTRVKRSPKAERSGAIATFTGRVRAKDAPDDEPTEYLEFEKYEGVAEARMATIERELEARDGVLEVELYHRTGVVERGEDIVFVVVLAGHREEAFRTVEDGINRLKDEVPLFKKEVTVDDEFWVHERSA